MPVFCLQAPRFEKIDTKKREKTLFQNRIFLDKKWISGHTITIRAPPHPTQRYERDNQQVRQTCQLQTQTSKAKRTRNN